MNDDVWCHKCASVLPCLYSAHKHLEDHQLSQANGEISNFRTSKPSLVQEGISTNPSPELFECYVCALSFKNEFMRVAHEALVEHHRRLGDYGIGYLSMLR
jgi:hypothetical protein